MIDLIFILLGFFFMIKGADILVDNSSALAKRFGISDIIIGLTVVAFGTSAPELAVNVLASLGGNTEIAIANILGSNIANIFLILGVASIIYPLTVKRETIRNEIPLSLFAAILLGVLANDTLIFGDAISQISRIDGLIFLGFFFVFLFNIYRSSKNDSERLIDIDDKESGRGIISLISFCALGIIALTLGGKWVVDGAVSIALGLGVSQALVGLTIVAIGTSLPELFTSAVAAFKGRADIAIGNVVGSNIFNIFWILGISATIRPLLFSVSSNIDVLAVVLASAVLFISMFVGQKRILERWQGGVFLIVYFVYIYAIVMRG